MKIAIELSTNGASIFGPTPNYYFQDTTNFEKYYFNFLPMSIVQGLRLIFGIVAVNFFMEQLYLGPNDIGWNFAALNEWAYMFTCVSNVF